MNKYIKRNRFSKRKTLRSLCFKSVSARWMTATKNWSVFSITVMTWPKSIWYTDLLKEIRSTNSSLTSSTTAKSLWAKPKCYSFENKKEFTHTVRRRFSWRTRKTSSFSELVEVSCLWSNSSKHSTHFRDGSKSRIRMTTCLSMITSMFRRQVVTRKSQMAYQVIILAKAMIGRRQA